MFYTGILLALFQASYTLMQIILMFTFTLHTLESKSKHVCTNPSMTGLLTLCACCSRIARPCLPSGAHKSLRGMNETDIKETNCGVMCTNKTPLTFSYGLPNSCAKRGLSLCMRLVIIHFYSLFKHGPGSGTAAACSSMLLRV